MFGITGNKGFHITFANGNTISVQFGGGNYCRNHNIIIMIPVDNVICNNAEIATWDKNKKWTTKEVWKVVFNENISDDVQGYVTSKQVAKLIEYLVK